MGCGNRFRHSAFWDLKRLFVFLHSGFMVTAGVHDNILGAVMGFFEN